MTPRLLTACCLLAIAGASLRSFLTRGDPMHPAHNLAPLAGPLRPASLRSNQPPAAPARPRFFEGARLIVGDGSAPIESSAFVVENGKLTRVGKQGDVRPPAGAGRVDLTGKTVMPALVNLHGHPGYQKGLTYAAENYTRDNLIDHLRQYARFGVAAVVAMGTDPGDLPFQVRKETRLGKSDGARYLTAGRGLAPPNAGPGFPALRPSPYGVASETEARKAVQELAARKVDFVKIWVDDRNGSVPKLQPALYRAIIDEAHKHKLRVVAHVYYHADATDLVQAGADGFAHLVRDREMDEALVADIKQRNVFVMPNLGTGERGTHADRPSWLDDPLLRATIAPEVLERAGDSFAKRDAAAVERSRQTYRTMQRSLAKLNAAGARIALGSDSGIPDHFMGFAEHRELELMVGAGMTPMQAIVAATRTPAEILGLNELGTLTAGKSADFIVLEANPLDDITNSRRIATVYLRGNEVAGTR